MRILLSTLLCTVLLSASLIQEPAGFAQDFSFARPLKPSKAEVKRYLRAFRKDPVHAMSTRLVKRDQQGNPVDVEPRFAAEDIATGAYVQARDEMRTRICGEVDGQRRCPNESGALSEIWGNDRPEELVGRSDIIRTLPELEKAGLLAAQLDRTPWSGDYWPVFQGMLGARYGDPQFPKSHNWYVNRSYIWNRPASALFNSGVQAWVNMLSPSEKYDALIGDWNGTLTAQNWAAGQGLYESYGRVEHWVGICDGWSAAASLLPRPAKAVRLVAADGRTPMTFFPADIKGLASLLWAKGRFNLRFVGGRCNDMKPAVDRNGRVISQNCFDTNPGTWHLAITNQIGVEKRSFILDATYDYEVWNQPAYAYAYSYWNPQTAQPVVRYEDAVLPRSKFTKDPFRSYRSSQTSYIVGIAMSVTYMVETPPTTRTVDDALLDRARTVLYIYDLELDWAGRIIGGEWYTKNHPDFVWAIPPGGRAFSNFDSYATGAWSPPSILPWSWQNAGVQAAYSVQPLGKIVEALFRKSTE